MPLAEEKVLTGARLARHIGAYARRMRQQKDLSHADVAALVGIAPDVYLRMEHGRLMPGASTFARLCAVLDMEADVAWGLSASRRWPRRESSPNFRRDIDAARLVDEIRGMSSAHLRLLTELATHMAHQRPSPSSGAAVTPGQGDAT